MSTWLWSWLKNESFSFLKLGGGEGNPHSGRYLAGQCLVLGRPRKERQVVLVLALKGSHDMTSG